MCIRDRLVCARDHDTCLCIWRLLCDILRDLGFSLSERKLQGPCHRLKWLGHIIDSDARKVFLPADKVDKCFAILDKFIAIKSKPSRREVDRLLGLLSWRAQVVYGGHAFMHRMRSVRYRDDLGHARGAAGHVYINHEFKAYCQWWRDNLVWLNGEVPLTAPCATCICLLYTSPSPRDATLSRMPSSA